MKPNPGRVILGGFVGTLAMTMMMYWVGPLMGMMKMDIAASLGSMLGGSWALGMMLHFINGTVIFSLIYVYLLFQVLPGGATFRGVEWGLILWFLAQAVVMPMMGGGFFSANMGGMMAAAGSLIGHAIYGGLLGWIGGSNQTFAETPGHVSPRAA
jgi:hypothetical protein